PAARHTTCGSVPGSDLAPVGISSGPQAVGNQVGVRKVTGSPKQKLRAVFLDRDGVINRAIVREGRPYPPATLEELEILPDASSALADLKDGGFLLLLITNQPDVGRG